MGGYWRVPIALLSTVVSIECFQSLQLFTSSLLFFGDHVYTAPLTNRCGSQTMDRTVLPIKEPAHQILQDWIR